MRTLSETVNYMLDVDYKKRLIGEYSQTKIRYAKLKDFCNRIEIYEEYGMMQEVKHDCPLKLLREQQKAMEIYLSVLEKRAIIEGIGIEKEVL